MSFDLSWLWDLLNTIVDTMQSWFTSLFSVATNIVNTGQGLFMGLVSLGSQLWDAFLKGVDAFGEWLFNAFKWIYDGITYWANVFGQWFSNAMAWIGSGVSWLAQQVYNMGMWFYNIGVFIWNWIVNTATALWSSLVTWFSGVASAISSWWTSVIGGINTWFTNLLKTFRQKIVTTIMADITIAGAWKGAERVLAPKKMSDIGYGLVGVVASPIIGRLVGEIVNAVVPLPSTSTYPLIPEIGAFAYTPPSLEITRPTEPTPPSVGAPPTPPAVGVGLPYDVTLKVWQKPTYDYTTVATSETLTMPTLEYEYEVT